MNEIHLKYIRNLEIAIDEYLSIQEVNDDIIEDMICLTIWIKPKAKIDQSKKKGKN